MINRVKFTHVLTIIVLAITFWVVYIVMTAPEFSGKPERTQVITAIVGVGIGAIGYWINSTNGSQRKTELIAQAQPVEQKEHV